MGNLFQRWQQVSVTSKFSFGFGTLLCLILLVVIMSYLSLTLVQYKTDTTLMTSTKIHRLLLEMEASFQPARRLYGDFFDHYPEIGLTEAQQQYVQPAQQYLTQTVTFSNRLARLTALPEINNRLRQNQVDLQSYLAAVSETANVAAETMTLATDFAAQETDLLAQLDDSSANLRQLVEASDQPNLRLLYQEMTLEHRVYLTTRQPADMEAVIAASRALQTALNTLPVDQQTLAGNQLSTYVAAAEQLLALDGSLQQQAEAFTTQAQTIDQLSAALITWADENVSQSQTDIDDLSQLMTLALVILTLGCLGVTVAVVKLLNDSITRNIRHLAEAVTDMQAGHLGSSAQIESGDEMGQLAQAFNDMAAQVQNLSTTLDERVAARTRTLETMAEISQQITTISQVDDLLAYVVSFLQTKFNFYHTQIYLFNEEMAAFILAESYGDIGQQLKQQGHQLQSGQGVVGQVFNTQNEVVLNDVTVAAEFVAHPLLPATQAELVLPLTKGEQLLGALDVHSEIPHRFTEELIAVLQPISRQIGVALDNLRQFAKTQAALEEVERLNRQLTRESWHTSLQEQEDITLGYQFRGGLTQPIKLAQQQILPALMEQAKSRRQLISQTDQNGNNELPDAEQTELAVPLILRGEVIGVLGIKRPQQTDWATEELAAVESVANQVTLALENSRLSAEQEKTIIKLKDLDRLKSEFLTSMSHELRTPLNAILGFSDVLLQGLDGELTEYAQNDIQMIYNSGQHLLTLINDILDINKIEAGMMDIFPEPLLVPPLVKDVMAASKTLLKEGVGLISDIPEDLPEVYADNIRLKQILLNLVGNAAKFTKEGSVTVKVAVSPTKPTMMRFAVIDTGIGISQEEQAVVFERFKQAQGGNTKEYGGTGLGLTICTQLVQMHGGEIGVNSEKGVGSEFFFTIPLADSIEQNN